jgi:hypothetical protein
VLPECARRLPSACGLVGLLLTGSALAQAPAAPGKPYLTVGLFFGRIEEGARIFTPVRLLPFGDPEGGTHQFPTLQQLHGTEFAALVWLGNQAGLRLGTTLQRYPTEPSADWPYPAFAPPPDSISLRAAVIARRPAGATPLPGLRAVLYDARQPILFLVDTRALTLAQRGMRGATAMGLDIARADLLRALEQAADAAPPRGLWAVIYEH